MKFRTAARLIYVPVLGLALSNAFERPEPTWGDTTLNTTAGQAWLASMIGLWVGCAAACVDLVTMVSAWEGRTQTARPAKQLTAGEELVQSLQTDPDGWVRTCIPDAQDVVFTRNSATRGITIAYLASTNGLRVTYWTPPFDRKTTKFYEVGIDPASGKKIRRLVVKKEAARLASVQAADSARHAATVREAVTGTATPPKSPTT